MGSRLKAAGDSVRDKVVANVLKEKVEEVGKAGKGIVEFVTAPGKTYKVQAGLRPADVKRALFPTQALAENFEKMLTGQLEFPPTFKN